MDHKDREDMPSVLLNGEKDSELLGALKGNNFKLPGESNRVLSFGPRAKVRAYLERERAKAMNTLQRASENDVHLRVLKTPAQANKENEQTINRTPGFDSTEFVPFRRQNLLNITDLVVEKTIHLESSGSGSSSKKNESNRSSKISFEPSEMTGRSTALSRDLNKENQPHNQRMLSVEAILASSRSADVRNLCDSLRESYCSNNTLSLPRTADMSKIANESLFSCDLGAAGYSFSNAKHADESCFSSENFSPAELMHSKLMNDELLWAQEYAAIPTAPNARKSPSGSQKSNHDTMSITSTGQNDPDFSMGSYFAKQSDNIWNIVPTRSPVKCRKPTALVDTTSGESDSGLIPVTPKPDDRTYSMHIRKSVVPDKKQLSKDSGNATDNSYLLSMSAIERALVDINTEDSDGSVVNRLLLAKKSKSNMNHNRKYLDTEEKPIKGGGNLGKSPSSSNSPKSVSKSPRSSEIVFKEENKENLDPESMKYSDTISFTDSVLNSSDMLKLSNTSSRSPLSPIATTNPTITLTDDPADLADLDEHPCDTYKDTSRKVRRHKSTRDISPGSTTSSLDVAQNHTQKRSPSLSIHKRTKSVSPRRKDIDPDVTPKPQKPAALHQLPKRSPSPTCFDSPISSPRSQISSQVSSPSWNGNSPQLDSTTNSDRRFLIGTISSPDCGKFSLPSYGLAARTGSTASLKARSTSRCSNSSEFSHRDGKLIPLKVTCLQLSWGSIRLRTSVQKSMQIKNTSSKRLIIKVDVCGPGFQIINIQGNLITLQSQECRSVTLNFYPTVIGAAVGVLSFSAPSSPSYQTYLDVPLYGYGGTASLIPQNVLKGPIGAPFLPIGELKELCGPIEKSFKLYNKGNLHGFAVVIIDPVGLDMPRLCDRIEIKPNKLLIPPESTATIRVIFKPHRDDIKKIIKKINTVMTLANMRIVCGDEASRQRIRKLIRTMNGDEKSQFNCKSLDKVWANFPNEVTVNDIDSLKEKSEVALDLISSLRVHEIALTLNHFTLDDTADSSLIYPDADETVVFRTFCSSPSHSLDTVDEEEQNESIPDSWSVQPNVLQFDSVMKFKIKNNFKQRKSFEVSCNYKHLFSFKPSNGIIEAGKEVDIDVIGQHEKPGILPTEQIDIWVYVQNERISIPVKVDKNYYPWNQR